MVHRLIFKKLKIFIFLNGQRGKSLFFFLNKKNKNITVISLNKKILNSLDIRKKFFFRNINSKSFEIFAKKNKPNLFILAGYPQIMKENIFIIPSIGTINLHAGELPFYKGGSPLNWAIINGEKTFETSIIEIDKGIDTGKLLAKKKDKILAKDNIDTVHRKANNNFKKIILEAINNLINKKFIKKSNKTPVYWHQRKEKDNHLDFNNKTSTQSYNFIRALTKPYPGAWVICNNKKLRLVDSKIICKKIISTPGKVFYRDNKPMVCCLKGAILLKNYYFEKNKKLQLKPGDLLR